MNRFFSLLVYKQRRCKGNILQNSQNHLEETKVGMSAWASPDFEKGEGAAPSEA